MPFQPKRRSFLAIWLLASGLAIVYIAMNWVTVIDDAYIFFRYAENIRNGHGYVFNIGQNVEGTTSLAWTLLLVGFAYLNAPLLWATKILSGLSVLTILAVLGFELDRRQVPVAIIALALSLLLFNPHFVLSIMMGLETGLFALCLLILCIAADGYLQTDGRNYGPWLGGAGVLLFMTRPESVGVLLLFGIGLIGIRLMSAKNYSLWPAGIWLLGIGAVTLWRWFTFGDYIPNSARAKSVLEFSTLFLAVLSPRVQAGLIYVKGLASVSVLLLAFGMIGLVSLRKHYLGVITLIVMAVGGGTVLLNSGDWMPFSRLLTPYLPLLALLAAIGLSRILEQLGKTRQHVFVLTAILLTIAVIGNAFWGLRDRTPFVADSWPGGRCYEQLGIVLRPHLSQQTLLAAEAIGILGYEVGTAPILDIFGLTDAEIAHNGKIPIETYTLGKHDYAYVMQQHPQVFVFHSHISNHIPLLNPWGYAQNYDTFYLRDPDRQCQLIVGLQQTVSPALLPILDQAFDLEATDVSALQGSSAATWPFGK